MQKLTTEEESYQSVDARSYIILTKIYVKNY